MEEISIKNVAREVAGYFGKGIEIIPGNLKEGSTKRRCPDITKLKNLGFNPKIPFKEGLKKTAKWYDENSDKIKKIK